jgi:hypothetical protein
MGMNRYFLKGRVMGLWNYLERDINNNNNNNNNLDDDYDDQVEMESEGQT